MPSYLVETYLSRSDASQRAARERRARTVAAELTSGRMVVRFERSIHIPEDEICFYVFEAASSSDAALAAERAQLQPIRIVEATSSGRGEPMNKRWIVALAGLIVAAATVVMVATASADGRQLAGAYCTNANAMPKPGACISLSSGDQTAEGYTGSDQRTISLRPGTYWLTVNDTSTVHNFSLESPDGSDQDITEVAGAPGSVTVKVNLTHGTWTLFCDPHRAMGMYVTIEVGGEGQVG